jgi:hypothetical protein
MLTAGRYDLSVGFGLFALFSVLGVSLARELEHAVPWAAAIPISAAGTAMLGPLIDATAPTLLVLGAILASSPPVRARLRRRRAGVPLARLSDRLLEARWLESEAELRRTSARPELALAVVRRRAELLDEIVRRQDYPRQS